MYIYLHIARHSDHSTHKILSHRSKSVIQKHINQPTNNMHTHFRTTINQPLTTWEAADQANMAGHQSIMLQLRIKDADSRRHK
jgi:hypothetical protein